MLSLFIANQVDLCDLVSTSIALYKSELYKLPTQTWSHITLTFNYETLQPQLVDIDFYMYRNNTKFLIGH